MSDLLVATTKMGQYTFCFFTSPYLEMRMDKSDITGDYILMITDFAPDGDTDTLEDIWDANMDMLHRSTGL